MKKNARFAALAAALALIVSLTACGESGDPLAAAMENMNKASSMDMTMVMEMDMEIGGETLESSTTMETTVFTEPMRMKINMNVDLGGLGTVDMETYAEEGEDGEITMYYSDSESQTWMVQTVATEDMEQYDLGGSLETYMDSASGFTQEGKETVDGVSAYKYTGVITGEKIQEVMQSSGAMSSMTGLDLADGEELAELLAGLEDIPVSLWISEKENCPIRYEMDMTAVMSGLMQAYKSEGIGEPVGISRMVLTMTCANLNSAAEFTIPEEARNAA